MGHGNWKPITAILRFNRCHRGLCDYGSVEAGPQLGMKGLLVNEYLLCSREDTFQMKILRFIEFLFLKFFDWAYKFPMGQNC